MLRIPMETFDQCEKCFCYPCYARVFGELFEFMLHIMNRFSWYAVDPRIFHLFEFFCKIVFEIFFFFSIQLNGFFSHFSESNNKFSSIAIELFRWKHLNCFSQFVQIYPFASLPNGWVIIDENNRGNDINWIN